MTEGFFPGEALQLDWELRFAYRVAPITENGRYHWQAKRRLVARVVEETRLLARAAAIPPLGRCDVTLTWFVNDRRTRDVENVVPTYKAMCDALVREGVVEDDAPRFMSKHMPVITFEPKATNPTPHMILRVAQITPTSEEKAA